MVYFFDLDGTLLDSNGVWLDLDIDFLKSRGISPVPQEYTDYVTHHSFPEAAVYTREQFSLPESPEEIIAQWKRMAWGAYSTALDLKPGKRLAPASAGEGGAPLSSDLLHAGALPGGAGAPWFGGAVGWGADHAGNGA